MVLQIIFYLLKFLFQYDPFLWQINFFIFIADENFLVHVPTYQFTLSENLEKRLKHFPKQPLKELLEYRETDQAYNKYPSHIR